ncbi:Type 1 phosphatases regulator ypi1 [Puccinia graminis f. sp. tritici]|uniref:Type 1 phosphatases regulator n=1 Tax=Puccinia graminis f. sp. tritici TaxID=56615 RepID=A0A5B0NEL5_PUCGR|nr:Type 1 phosphatases regulator ypi1 [Puccinia graminis f. sp. tritici]
MATENNPQSNLTAVRQNDRLAPARGSRTMVIDQVQDSGSHQGEDSHANNSSSAATLILRAGPLQDSQPRQPRVQWQENVIDNEGLGRKKSKVCCIYNKPKAFDESSDESDHSDSDCCPTRSSGARPCPSTTSTTQVRMGSTSQPTPSHSLPTPPRSPNAYEAEPSKSKGKGKA